MPNVEDFKGTPEETWGLPQAEENLKQAVEKIPVRVKYVLDIYVDGIVLIITKWSTRRWPSQKGTELNCGQMAHAILSLKM